MCEYYYRIDEWHRSDGNVSLHTDRIPVLRKTRKGVWLGYGEDDKRFVLNDARKRYACPTVEEAMESFKARKRRQIGILQGQLERAKMALEEAEGNGSISELCLY